MGLYDCLPSIHLQKCIISINLSQANNLSHGAVEAIITTCLLKNWIKMRHSQESTKISYLYRTPKYCSVSFFLKMLGLWRLWRAPVKALCCLLAYRTTLGSPVWSNLHWVFLPCLYRHIRLSFYSKPLLPSTKWRRRFPDRQQAGRGEGQSQSSAYKWGDQPVTYCWTAGLEGLTPFIIFACCVWSQFTEPKAVETQSGC